MAITFKNAIREAVSPPPVLPNEETPGKNTSAVKALKSGKAFNDVNPNAGSSAFNIGNFRSNATLQDSILPKHSFLVTFSPFTATQKAARVLNKYLVGTAASDLVMRCDSAQLPGVTALKDEVSRFGYGPVEDMTYGMQFADMTLGFIVNKKGLHYKFFNDWMSLITNYASKGGGDMMNKNNAIGMPYQVGYKDDYSNLQMNITVFDRSHNQVLVYELYDVFPISINAQDVSWGDVDQLMRIYVRFAYTDFTLKTPLLGEGLPSNWDDIKPKAAAPNQNPNEEKTSATQQKSGGLVASLGGTTAQGTTPPTVDTQTVPAGVGGNPDPVKIVTITPAPGIRENTNPVQPGNANNQTRTTGI
jgi:hypothetical protein